MSFEGFIARGQNAQRATNEIVGKRVPAQTWHVGSYLLEELTTRNVKPIEFADFTGINRGRLSELLRGRRQLTAYYALLIATALGVSVELLLNLQRTHDLRLAHKRLGKRLEKMGAME